MKVNRILDKKIYAENGKPKNKNHPGSVKPTLLFNVIVWAFMSFWFVKQIINLLLISSVEITTLYSKKVVKIGYLLLKPNNTFST